MISLISIRLLKCKKNNVFLSIADQLKKQNQTSPHLFKNNFQEIIQRINMIINCEKCYKIIRPIEYFDMVNIFNLIYFLISIICFMLLCKLTIYKLYSVIT